MDPTAQGERPRVEYVARLLIVAIIAVMYEQRFMLQTWRAPDLLRFPLFDVALADHPLVYVILEGLYAALLVAMCLPRMRVSVSVLAGVASFALVSLDLTEKFQFYFLPGFCFLAFALSEVLRREGRLGHRADFPFVAFVASVYGFASFHKLLNFQVMQETLPTELLRQSFGALGPVCGDAHCALLRTLAWVVVPVEATMAILTARRPWLRPRLVFVSIFHWSVAVAADIANVSVLLLAVHVLIACLQQPETARRVFRDRHWGWLLFAEVIFLAGSWPSAATSGLDGSLLLLKICRTNLFLFPLWFLLLPFMRTRPALPPEPPRAPGFRWQAALPPAFLAVLLVFGCSPLLLDEPYSVSALGWQAFCGGHQIAKRYQLETPLAPCFQSRDGAGLIRIVVKPDRLVYVSTRELDLRRLRSLFERERNCFNEPQGSRPQGSDAGYRLRIDEARP